MTGRDETSPPLAAAVAPRGITKADAAAYLNISPDTFDDWRARGIVPPPIPGTHRWDRVAIDDRLDRLAGLAASSETEPDTRARERIGDGL